jgi:hypothetical protein
MKIPLGCEACLIPLLWANATMGSVDVVGRRSALSLHADYIRNAGAETKGVYLWMVQEVDSERKKVIPQQQESFPVDAMVY